MNSDRYRDLHQQGADLLREVLMHAVAHRTPLHPVTFAVWYEYATGINPALTAAIDQLKRESKAIDEDQIDTLYIHHVAPPPDLAVERVGGEMRRLMSTVVDSASRTGSHAGAFSAQLNDLTQALSGADLDVLGPHLSAVQTGTKDMRNSVDALQQMVKSSQAEIERLRCDLDQARDDALTDPLTGVLNRKGFDMRLRALLGQRPDHHPACLVLLDLDHFKGVNDTHGHLMGDRVLEAMGEVLRQQVASADAALARYGGEEFALLLPDCTLEQAQALAESVRQHTAAMKFRHRTTREVILEVTVSGGVTPLMPGDDPRAAISRADTALYEAKQGGRNRIVTRTG